MIRTALIACLALLMLGGRAGAQQIVELRPDTQHVEIYQNIWFLFDERGSLTLEQVIASPEKFQRNTHNSLNFGEAGPVIWLRADVINIGSRDGEWLFATRLTSPDILDIYLVRGGKTELLFTAADRTAAAASLKRYFAMVAPFTLNAGEAGTLYARYRGQKTSRMPLSISSFESASAARQDRYLINGIIAAIVIALVAYSTAIFLIISGRTILYYAASEIAMLLIILESNGLLSVNIWPETAFLQRFGGGIMNALHVVFTILFTRAFFQLDHRAPKTDLILRIWMGVAIAYLAATALLYRQPEFLSVNLFASYFLLTPVWVFLPLLAAAATWRWDINYWPLIPGWGIVVAGHLYWVLILRGLVPEPPFHPQLLGLIAVANAFFLSIAIVLQVRQRQRTLNNALRDQLSAANAKAEILRELAEQDRLVHAAGHDSRTILLGLRNYAAGLAQGAGAAHVKTAAQAITQLTNDLEAVLGTTMASAAHMGDENVLALESAPLGQVMAAVRLIHERVIRDKGLRFSVRSSNHELVTDRPLLARILGNLVENASKYTQQGGIVLAARRHGDILRIQVWDSGCGIAPDLLTALLDPAAGRLRASDQGAGQGSGLQIAKSLAARIGGAIDACSRPGHGSCFELRLPLAPPEMASRAPQMRRLWVLENTLDAALRLQGMAAGLGVQVNYVALDAPDGLFAPETLDSDDYVLIAENYGGVRRGREVAHQLRALLPRGNIFISTYDRGVDVRAALSNSAGIILYEPVTPDALRFALYSAKPSTSAME